MHGIQAADHDADDHAGHDLQGRILAAKALDLMYGKAKKSTLGADGKPLTELKPEVKSEESKEEQAAE